MRHVAVFDTNVLLSAVVWKGKPFACVESARSGLVEGVTCKEIVSELADRLEHKLKLAPTDVADVLADLLSFLRMETITNQFHAVAADADDDKVLECGVVAGATHIVTGDKRHLLPLKSFQDILIVSPADFLDSITGGASPRTEESPR